MLIDRSVFKQKRYSQTSAAESILNLADYSKQYKMVEIVLEKLFKVLQRNCLYNQPRKLLKAGLKHRSHSKGQDQAPVVQTMDITIHRKNHYPADRVVFN